MPAFAVGELPGVGGGSGEVCHAPKQSLHSVQREGAGAVCQGLGAFPGPQLGAARLRAAHPQPAQGGLPDRPARPVQAVPGQTQPPPAGKPSWRVAPEQPGSTGAANMFKASYKKYKGQSPERLFGWRKQFKLNSFANSPSKAREEWV